MRLPGKSPGRSLFAIALLAVGCGGSSPAAPSAGPPPPAAATPTPTPQPTPTPTPAPTPAPTPTPDPGPTVLREASFQSANGYFTEGRAVIIRERGGHRLETRSDFRTSQSAALEVRLCRSTSCGPNDLNLGSIQGFSGVQRYTLPDASTQYAYAVIWCTAVNLPFGFGELR